jgi:type IV pilus assembly protein PilQ
MEVKVSKGSFGERPSAQAPPNTTIRDVSTNVLVDNGSTVVLGGLYNTLTSESHSGIPFLKDLPLVGWLFRTPHNPATARNELLIFLTPRIINQEEAGLINRSSDSSAKM